jgi:conjugative transfer signal peptidase TraF
MRVVHSRTTSRFALQRRWPLGVIAILVLVIGLSDAVDLRINTTASMPLGLYREVTPRLERGTLVVFCLGGEAAAFGRQRGYLPAGQCQSRTQELVKRVAALPGDTVALSRSGVRVNGQEIARTSVRGADANGRSLPHAPFVERRLQAGELWVLGTARERSWDSRYFGPIRTEQVRASAVPLWTFPSSSDDLGGGQ